MGASTQDVNLIVIHDGKKSFWSGMKACGHVLLDLRFGLYSDDPKPDLSWFAGTAWEEILQPLDKPLKDPVYGQLVVDFDRRVIINDSGWSPFEMYPQWLAMTWSEPRDAPVSKNSVVEHLAKQRLRLSTLSDTKGAENDVVTLPPQYKAMMHQVNEVKYQGGASIHFSMPEGWSMETTEE